MSIILPPALDDVIILRKYQHETSRGVAFAAEVIRAGQSLGTIENKGLGDDTRFHHNTAEDLAWWNNAVAEFTEQATAIATADAAAWGTPSPEGPLDPTIVSEYLADTLFDLTD